MADEYFCCFSLLAFYSATVAEDLMEDMSIVKIVAYDADDGTNADITYSITEVATVGDVVETDFEVAL